MPTARIENWRQRLARDNLSLTELEADIRAAELEIEEGEKALQEQRAELDARKQERDALIGLRNFLAHGKPGPIIPPAGDGGRVTKPAAVTAFLRTQNRAAKVGAIRDALIEEGVIEDTPEAYHGLQVTLSHMFRKGRVARPKMGYYKLPPETATRE
jgi:hypothetical protein